MSEPRYYLIELAGEPHYYSFDYWRPGTPRPTGFTLWRETEDEIRALAAHWNARVRPENDGPDDKTIPLFGEE